MSLADLLAQATGQEGTLNSLPLAAHVLAATGLIAGLILWVMGRRVLRPIFCILGCLAGAGTGFFLMAQATDTMFGIPSPYIGLGIGSVLGLAAAIMLFRFAVAIATGVALGLAGVLIAAAYLNFRPAPPADAPPTTSALSAPGFVPLPRTREEVVEAVRPVAQKVKEVLAAKAQDIRTAWDARSGQDRAILAIAGLGSAAVGFVLGLFAPRRSAAIATALAGSAVALASSAWLISAAQLPGREYLDQTAIVWLIIWLVVAAMGVAVQITTIKKKKSAQPQRD